MTLFVNNLTTPRALSKQELLVNGLFLFQEPKDISDFTFESGKSKVFTKDNLLGKWSLIYFGFSRCPDECPVAMYEISKLVNVLREKEFYLEDKQWILITIDPERDTPEIIDSYAKGFDSDFVGLSANRPMLLNLATQLAVNNKMPPMDKNMGNHKHLDDHVNNIILINPEGKFVGFFRPPFDISRLSLTYQSITQAN
jgi:protein SCO1/2